MTKKIKLFEDYLREKSKKALDSIMRYGPLSERAEKLESIDQKAVVHMLNDLAKQISDLNKKVDLMRKKLEK